MATLSKKNNHQELIEFLRIQRQLVIKKARRDFWSFCRLMYPNFYTPSKPYLRELCHTLQAFYEGEIDKQVLIINLPPRHGKTFTAKNFLLWLYGQDKSLKAISASYNQILSSLFAQQTRDGIMQENENAKALYFSDIFPEIKIKQGDAAKGFWSLEGSQEKNYLASSPGGTSTGIGANIIVVDDIIKSAKDAYNRRILQEHWDWYNNTLVQRMERPRKQIIIMTRWSSEDLAGRMEAARPGQIHKVEYQALQDDGTMLSDEIMTREEYENVTQEMGADIASANYQQKPINLEGQLYKYFSTYDDVPRDPRGNPAFERIVAYTDTADTGKDYLCMITAGIHEGKAYVLDILYTQDSMDKTEITQADRMVEHGVNSAIFEGNNGGSNHARTIEKLIFERYKRRDIEIDYFHQSENKEARILSNQTNVQRNVLYPADWEQAFKEYADAMKTYQRKGSNDNDDAPDATTGLIEKFLNEDTLLIGFA